VNTMALLPGGCHLVFGDSAGTSCPFFPLRPSPASGVLWQPESFWAVLAVVDGVVVNYAWLIVLLAYTEFSPGLEGLDQWGAASAIWHEGLGAKSLLAGGHGP